MIFFLLSFLPFSFSTFFYYYYVELLCYYSNSRADLESISSLFFQNIYSEFFGLILLSLCGFFYVCAVVRIMLVVSCALNRLWYYNLNVKRINNNYHLYSDLY